MYDNQHQMVHSTVDDLPTLFSHPAVEAASRHFLRKLKSDNTRRAYLRAARSLSDWCTKNGVKHISQLDGKLAEQYINELRTRASRATVNLGLSALLRWFDWHESFRVARHNPFWGIQSAPRPKGRRRDASFSADDLRRLVDSIDTTSISGMRDRALIGLLAFYFLSVRRLRTLRPKDFVRRAGGIFLRVGYGKDFTEIECDSRVSKYVMSYLVEAKVAMRDSSPLFRSVAGASGHLTWKSLGQPDIYRIVSRRAKSAGLRGKVSPREVRATALKLFLEKGGRIDEARLICGHKTSRSTIRYAPVGATRPRGPYRTRMRHDDLDDWYD